MRRKPPTPPSLPTQVQHWRTQLWHHAAEEEQLKLAEELEWKTLHSRKTAELLVPVFMEALSHPATAVRHVSGRMLAALGNRAGNSQVVLWEQLQGEDAYLRGCALMGLARSGAEGLEPSIKQLLDENHRWSVYAALQAMMVLPVTPTPFLERLQDLFQHPERLEGGVFPLGPRENGTTGGTIRRMLLCAVSEMPTSFQVLLPEVVECARFPEELYWVADILKHWQTDPVVVQNVLLEHLKGTDKKARDHALDAFMSLQLEVDNESKHLLLNWAALPEYRREVSLPCVLWWGAGEREVSTRLALNLFEEGLKRTVGWPFQYHKVIELLWDLGELTPERFNLLKRSIKEKQQGDCSPSGPLLLLMQKRTGDSALILPEISKLLESGDQPYWMIQCLKLMGEDARPVLGVLQALLERDDRLIRDSRPIMPMLRLPEEDWVRTELTGLVNSLQVERE